MKFTIEIPDDWSKESKTWNSSQIMTCNQCLYKTPSAAMFVTHMFAAHTTADANKEEDSTLVIDK